MCYQNFDADDVIPIVLPCGHTLCIKDVSKIDKCPQCKICVLKWKEKVLKKMMIRNYALLSIIEQNKEKEKKVEDDIKIQLFNKTVEDRKRDMKERLVAQETMYSKAVHEIAEMKKAVLPKYAENIRQEVKIHFNRLREWLDEFEFECNQSIGRDLEQKIEELGKYSIEKSAPLNILKDLHSKFSQTFTVENLNKLEDIDSNMDKTITEISSSEHELEDSIKEMQNVSLSVHFSCKTFIEKIMTRLKETYPACVQYQYMDRDDE